DAIPSLMRDVVEQAKLTFVRANFTAFGPSSLDFELLFEAEVAEIAMAKAEYQKVALGILRAFNQRGIEFAYPTQTTFTAAPDGTMIVPYPPSGVFPVAPSHDAMSRS
ncbi:MAG: mechanosensitive ion channel family protein, partial [Alphaproteobacteria bacterium]|nr:mechanosensitive ion channel family protein [Alphaproteobacteria bacterium]